MEAEDGKPKLSAKELRIQKRLAETAAKAAAVASASSSTFGDAPLIQSQEITGRVWTRISAINPSLEGKTVLVRGRIHTSRATGANVFVVLRQSFHTIQAVCFPTKTTPKEMIKYIESVPKESVVDVEAEVVAAPAPITSTSQQNFELRISKFFTISKAAPQLPFQLEDASRPDSFFEGKEEDESSPAAGGAGDPKYIRVLQDTRLDNRWIDLRTPANQAIMRISSGVCKLFREFLLKQKFVEIQTPKLVGGASEGGSAVFRLEYFGEPACLAQSPQLYKQMCAACSDFERVFEIGPVFRAESSNTHRHLTEFHGLDVEMVIHEHYYEVLDVFSDLFIYIFEQLKERFATEIEAVRAQHPFEDLVFLKPSLRLTYAEGIALLNEAGYPASVDEDLTTEFEKALGKIVKDKYGTDFFMMDKYPLAVRPFYTMPDPDNPKLSNSYDMFIRGEEIVSGAQRIHDVDLLVERATALGVPVPSIQSYVDSFRHGALPHGGGGIGLERVVMLFLGLKNIRKCCMFPRDPKRLTP